MVSASHDRSEFFRAQACGPANPFARKITPGKFAGELRSDVYELRA
jgi:hypothetical protein